MGNLVELSYPCPFETDFILHFSFLPLVCFVMDVPCLTSVDIGVCNLCFKASVILEERGTTVA